MSNKFEMFQNAGNISDFSVRDAIDFTVEDDPQRIGRKAMKNVAKIDLEQIIAKDQVRTKYNPVKHEEMKASLNAHGQQQPIVVYWSDEDAKYVVFMGHRRLRAAREVERIDTLACLILSEPPTEAERLEKQLVENLIRENLNAVDEARAYADIMNAKGCTAKDLAQQLGRAASTIQRSVKMLQLPEDILEDVSNGLIPKSVIREIQKLKSEGEQRDMVTAYKSGTSYKEIAKEVTQKPGSRSKKQVERSASRTKKVFSTGGIKLQATASRKMTKAQVIGALEDWIEQLSNDRRGKKAA